MNLKDLTKDVRSMTDEELQEEMARLRAARRMTPEKKRKKASVNARTKAEPISPDII